jgi:hypothetical protein
MLFACNCRNVGFYKGVQSAGAACSCLACGCTQSSITYPVGSHPLLAIKDIIIKSTLHVLGLLFKNYQFKFYKSQSYWRFI